MSRHVDAQSWTRESATPRLRNFKAHVQAMANRHTFYLFSRKPVRAAAWMPLPRNSASMVGTAQKAQPVQRIVMDAGNRRIPASMVASKLRLLAAQIPARTPASATQAA
jgi:hypothetical protein